MEKQGKNVIGSVVLVLVVVLVVAISALILGSVLGAEVFSGTSGSTVENLSNVTNITAVDFTVASDATCVLSAVQNASNQVVITSGNYTQPTTCSILATNTSNFIGDSWNVNYTFTTPGDAGSVINITELTDGFGGFITGLISFLAVIGIIVGVMWLVFYIRPLFSKSEGIQNFDAN